MRDPDHVFAGVLPGPPYFNDVNVAARVAAGDDDGVAIGPAGLVRRAQIDGQFSYIGVAQVVKDDGVGTTACRHADAFDVVERDRAAACLDRDRAVADKLDDVVQLGHAGGAVPDRGLRYLGGAADRNVVVFLGARRAGIFLERVVVHVPDVRVGACPTTVP